MGATLIDWLSKNYCGWKHRFLVIFNKTRPAEARHAKTAKKKKKAFTLPQELGHRQDRGEQGAHELTAAYKEQMHKHRVAMKEKRHAEEKDGRQEDRLQGWSHVLTSAWSGSLQRKRFRKNSAIAKIKENKAQCYLFMRLQRVPITLA